MTKFNYKKWVIENKYGIISEQTGSMTGSMSTGSMSTGSMSTGSVSYKLKPKKFNAQKKSEILQQMFALKEQTNIQTQTIQGGGCNGDIIVNHTYNSVNPYSAFIHLGNTYGTSANFADYAFPATGGPTPYVNIGLSLIHDNLPNNLSGTISYPSLDAAIEEAGVGPFTTVQAFLQSLTAVGGGLFNAPNCHGVTGVDIDNSLPTTGFEPAVDTDTSDTGVAPGMKPTDMKSKPVNMQRVKRAIREEISRLKTK